MSGLLFALIAAAVPSFSGPPRCVCAARGKKVETQIHADKKG
jgi:hypothetical protein